jgi:hypothetical protein
VLREGEGEEVGLQLQARLDSSSSAYEGCVGSLCAKQALHVLVLQEVPLEEAHLPVDHQGRQDHRGPW